jgi:molybdopterin-binding protein
MKVSARNHFSGGVKDVVPAPVSTEAKVSIAPGIDVVAIISTTAANHLQLAVGAPAHVLIKASSVMIGVD